MRPSPERILDYREFPVLYLDDEPENLRIFELAFRREYSILTASTADEALSIISERPVAIVLSDQRMPGMEGTEFLARVCGLDPKTVRVLVTAYGDAETLESAINAGSIYRFIAKPWSPEDMRATIRRGIEVYALDRERDQLVRELTLLNQTSKRINENLEYGSLVKLLVETITDEFGYDAAGYLAYDRKREALVWKRFSAGDSGVGERLRDIEISANTAPRLLASLSEGRTELFCSAELLEQERPIREWLTEVAAEETMLVPLVGKESLSGVMFVDNRRGGSAFSVDDRTLIEGLVSQAVVAMENARLIDDLKRSREQVMRSERLGILGTLAAGLAHEINNPLVSIHTFLSMAPERRNDESSDFWTDYHALACEEVERIRRLVETMRQLGRGERSDAVRETIELGSIARQVVRLVGPLANQKKATIDVTIAEDAQEIVAARDEIHQVVMNLVLNAIQAVNESGAIFVNVFRDMDRSECVIEVGDDGPGVSSEDLDQIFDPFFTTKEPDEGSGLGLMICHRIVAEHDGVIEVKGGDGGGAVFSVRLPSR